MCKLPIDQRKYDEASIEKNGCDAGVVKELSELTRNYHGKNILHYSVCMSERQTKAGNLQNLQNLTLLTC